MVVVVATSMGPGGSIRRVPVAWMVTVCWPGVSGIIASQLQPPCPDRVPTEDHGGDEIRGREPTQSGRLGEPIPSRKRCGVPPGRRLPVRWSAWAVLSTPTGTGAHSELGGVRCVVS